MLCLCPMSFVMCHVYVCRDIPYDILLFDFKPTVVTSPIALVEAADCATAVLETAEHETARVRTACCVPVCSTGVCRDVRSTGVCQDIHVSEML